MQTDSITYPSYFAPTLQPLHSHHHQTSLKGFAGTARMSGSPYTASAQLHSNHNSGLNLGHFSSPIHSINSHSLQSPLHQASLAYSPYSSDLSAASAESPLSSSSANESPLPEPSIDNMDYDTSAQIVTANDDYYPCTLSDHIAAASYPYAHIGARPFPLPGHAVENPEFYKQPVSAPLPMNVSVAMGYSWSPEAKKFQPLYPPVHQIQRQEHNSPRYTTQPSAAAPTHSATRSTSASAQSFGQEIEEADLYSSQVSSRSYVSAHTHLTQQPSSSLTGYPQLRKNIDIKQENDLHFADSYNQSADVCSSSSGLGLFGALLETGPHNSSVTSIPRNADYSGHTASPPTESSSTLDLALRYAHSPNNQATMNAPVLSAPVPRHSAYFGTSLVTNCERTCQEQEQQQQERQALRVQTQGLQEQRTVRPAEVSPVMSFAVLPEGSDDDAEGELDVESFSLHGRSSTSEHNTGRLRLTRAEGVFDYAGKLARGIVSEAVGDGDDEAERVEERNGRGFHDDYRAEERDDDDGDGDFVPHSQATSKNTRSLRSRSVTGRNPVRYQPYGIDILPSAVKRSPRSPLASPSDMSPSSSGQPGKMRKNARTLPIPVPIPNLTKKSRGRRVPTMNGTNPGRGQRDAALGARIYLCDVSGCGKCFARGEHLKRHIRSIHTYEKPHRCPYPGCGKEFSRHDNLGQHMKVHKDYSKVLERIKADEA